MTKCQGCGALFQNEDETKEGYTKDLEKSFCQRCFRIKNYNEYKLIDKSSKYFLNIISDIEKTKDLILLVIDFLNIDSINELNIKNPIILILNKRDLIPRHIDENKLLAKIKSNLNIVDKIIVGSKNNYNLDLLMDKINNYKKSKNVYVVGYTNVGKSTLINKIIKNYSENKLKITTSVLPSTTLNLIEANISDNLTVIDTPGLLDQGSIIINIDSKKLEKILPKKEIKPLVIQIKTKQTIIVDDIFRLDVNKETDLIFYMSNDLKLTRYYKDNDKLINLFKHNIEIGSNNDLVIKGLGFIKTTKDCNLTLYLDKKITFNIRDSII